MAVRYIEEVTQHRHRLALLAVAQQGGHRYAEKLPEQIEQGAFNCRDRVDGDAQVEGLVATAGAVAVGKAGAHAVQDMVPVARRLADDEFAGVFQRLADFFAARHLADADVAQAVRQHEDVAGKEGGVGTAEVEQHAVMAGDRDDTQVGDARRRGRRA